MQQSAKRVLVVEDSRAISNMLVSTIRSELYIDVESAANFKEAQQILERNGSQFFVAILDLNLPDAPNGEIVDLVIEMGIPPIVLTASMSDDLHDEMIEKSVLDYVIKRNLNEIEYVIKSVKRLRDNSGRKVLVVDDSKSSRLMISTLLKRQYLKVFEASNGADALKILDEHEDIALMIVDYNMPVMDGTELTVKVREKFARDELSIIGISTTGTGTVSIKFLKSGANDFITRPFMYEELYCRINQNMDSAVNRRMLIDATNRDFLTGLFNRRYFFETGEKLFQNARREHITLMVAMFDIDFFKNINDTYGHHMGDMALKHIASIFTRELRETDIIARMGGEEFCLLGINIDDSNSNKLLERYRKAIEDNPLVTDDLTVPVTVSVGYTSELTGSLEQMVNNADCALYEAKERGRNRVVHFANTAVNEVREGEGNKVVPLIAAA